jgi:hypothetical protein
MMLSFEKGQLPNRSVRLGLTTATGLGLAMALAACSGSVSIGGSSPPATPSTSAPSSAAPTSSSPRPSGTGELLDTEKLNGLISAKIASVAPGVKVSVKCPTDIRGQQGTTFDCPVTINGQPLVVKVRQKDDQGNVSYEAQSSILFLDQVRLKTATQLAEQIPGDWTTTCDPAGASGGIYVATPGTTFTCSVSGTAADGSQESGEIEVEVKDVDGNITWKLVPNSGSLVKA